MLLLGDPGTAKSQLLKYLEKVGGEMGMVDDAVVDALKIDRGRTNE